MALVRRAQAVEDPAVVEESLRAVDARLAALRTLGVAAPALDAKAAEGRRALADGDPGLAQARADEVLSLLKLAAGELAGMLAQGGAPARAAEGVPAPSAVARPASARAPAAAPEVVVPADVAAVVEDAFQKALHSRALRQMVEVIAAERVRALLADSRA